MVKLSFIAPAFNSSQTIQRCLDSIYSLPFAEADFEVIVVDDCSTDDTVSIVEEYAAGHHNLNLIRQTSNHRQGAARNRGIDLARGEYIAFVDSDDSIVSEGFVHAMNAVSVSMADVCYYDFEFQTPDGEWRLLGIPDELRRTVMDSKDYLDKYYTTAFNGPPRTIYRSAFLKGTGIRFAENVQWEDCDWTVKIYSRAKSIQFVDGIGYRYWYNSSSTSKQRSVQSMSDRVHAGNRLMVFGAEIKERLPHLSETIFTEGKVNYVKNALRLRNLTKYSFAEVKTLQALIDSDCRKSLLAFDWPCWELFFLRFKRGSMIFLRMACPSASFGRRVIRFVRGL